GRRAGSLADGTSAGRGRRVGSLTAGTFAGRGRRAGSLADGTSADHGPPPAPLPTRVLSALAAAALVGAALALLGPDPALNPAAGAGIAAAATLLLPRLGWCAAAL